MASLKYLIVNIVMLFSDSTEIFPFPASIIFLERANPIPILSGFEFSPL